MTVILTNDNLFLNDQGQVVAEINGANSTNGGTRHIFAPDGTEVSGFNGVADREVQLNIAGFELNTYSDSYKQPNGDVAFTEVFYNNATLPSWGDAINQYFNQFAYNSQHFKIPPPLAFPSIYRHSNNYEFDQSDGHGNLATERFVNGRLDSAGYGYANNTFADDQFDTHGNLTLHQSGKNGGQFTRWAQNSDGATWTKTVFSQPLHPTVLSTETLAAKDALQQVANDAATHWAAGSFTISASGGQLVGNEGDLLINKDFQYIVNGTNLLGQDVAGLADLTKLIGHDGGSLISPDGAGLNNLQLASLIGHDGGSLIGHDGGSLLSQVGANTIAQGGGNVISHDGGTLISPDGASLISNFASALSSVNKSHSVGTRLVDAVVFADSNLDGKLDGGEVWTTTDADGAFSLPGAGGPLVVIGGIDAATNLPFKGTMVAPAGSSIISPLTTLTDAVWQQAGDLDLSMNTVDQAFGLSGVDLTTLDPVAGIQNGDAISAQVYVAGVKVFDTADLMTSTLKGMGADSQAAENAVLQAMVGDLLQGGPLNLDDASTVSALFTAAATGVGLDGSAAADGVAKIIVDTNAQLDAALAGNSVGQGLLDALTPVETNVQGTLSSGLVAAAGDPNKIADIAQTPPDQTPPVHSGPPHWMASVDILPHPAGWTPAGIGDFNHDGSGDLAWFNSTTGGIDIWELANGQWSASSDVGTHPAGYQPVGFGDYNHDGTRDVLWFNPTTRDVDLWEISNGHWSASVGVGPHPAGYNPAHTGDFNGDGTADVFWFNPVTRDVDIWEMSNGHWSASVDVGTHPAGYQQTVIGDFNGDHTSDVAWFNPTTGDVDIWKISNGQWAGSVDVGAHPAGYKPIGAADLNHDGTSDIVWYNPSSNDIDVWLLNDNGQWSASVGLGAHPAGAVPVGLGDFDHNGVPDLMWQDTHTGHIDNWMLTIG